MYYVIYEKATGKVTSIGTCPDFVFSAQEPADTNLGLIEAPSHSWEYYVDISGLEPVIAQKTDFSLTVSSNTLLADGIEEVTVSNIPVGTLVTWPDGVETEVNDGQVVFSVDLVGEHTFKFSHVAHLTTTEVFTATEV